MTHPLRERIACGELCRHLRTKTMFIAGEDGPQPDVPQPTNTAVFWCNVSGWAMGPDLAPACPDGCAASSGRSCCESVPSA